MYFAFLQEAKLFPEPHLPTRLLWHPLPILSPCSHQAPCSEAQPRSYLLSKLSWLSEETALTGGSVVKESAYQCRRCGGSVPESGRSPEDGHGNPLQCFYLENRVDRGAWQGYRPWGRKESDAMEWLSPVISLFSCCLYLAPWFSEPLVWPGLLLAGWLHARSQRSKTGLFNPWVQMSVLCPSGKWTGSAFGAQGALTS